MSLQDRSNSTKFVDLSEDILTECLMFLDAQNLLRCRQICSNIRTLIDTDIRLQYTIELYANNMVHNPRLERPEPLYLRLKHLAEHQRRLRYPRLEKIDSFSFSQTAAFPLNEDRISAAIVEGIHVAWTTFGSLVRFTQVPSTRNLGIRFLQYDLRLVDGRLVHPSFDPTQDLVVVLETTIVNDLTYPLVSVRSLLTGEKHPMAENLVCWLGDSDIPLDGLLIAACADHVALTIRHLGDSVARVVVINWKTSNIIQDIRRKCILQGYEWLTERYLLLLETHSNPTTLVLTAVDVLNLDHPVICTLNLPRMLESPFRIDNSVQIRTHPSSQGILSQTDVPFFPNQENKVVLVSFYAHFFGGFIVVVLASDLLRIVQNTRKDSISVIAWDDWGPTHTRVIQPKAAGWSHVSVYGTRALVQDTHGRLTLYDFNQKLIRRDLAKQTADFGEVVIEPTVVHNERLFMNEVKTCLPYRIVHIPRPREFYPARTCELRIDSLIFMPRSATGNDNVDIYSF